MNACALQHHYKFINSTSSLFYSLDICLLPLFAGLHISRYIAQAMRVFHTAADTDDPTI